VRTLIASIAAFVALGCAQAAAAATVSVSPAPGTLTAMVGTQISFRGAAAGQLGPMTVTGSQSGDHPGTLKAHSDGRGASFVPAKPFTAGERVTVRTGLDIPGAAGGDFSFTIGVATTHGPRVGESPKIGRGSVQSYASRPDLDPPAFTVSTNKPGTAPGLVFLAPKSGRGQDGPMIIDNAGRLVWFKPIRGGDLATDFRVQSYDGKPVLTWWQGHLFTGDGDGTGEIYDSSYKPVATVRAGNGYPFDLHEFTITPRGTALVTVYQRYKRDLRPWGGTKSGRIVDSIVQEIDIKTGLVEFEWHSFGTISPSESFVPAPVKRGFEWDYMHVNSAAVDGNGDYIVSGRHTWGIYKISHTTGAIVWRLGGKKSDFTFGAGAKFAWQHDAMPQPDGTLTVFDNEAGNFPVGKKSRAITLVLDETKHTATLKTALSHPRGLLTATQGDVQKLPNGDTFVGFGSQRWFSEFSPTGQLLFDGHLATGNDSYRAYRFPWTGTPSEPARIAATTDGAKTIVHASWNGATQIARWELLGGATPGTMAVLASAPSAGFETTITVPAQGFVAMRALDAQGNRLASTAAIAPASGM
jgi:hypothetical protein